MGLVEWGSYTCQNSYQEEVRKIHQYRLENRIYTCECGARVLLEIRLQEFFLCKKTIIEPFCSTRRGRNFGYQFMFRARMYRSLIPVSNSVKDQRTAHSCAKHKLITEISLEYLFGFSVPALPHIRVQISYFVLCYQ